MSLRVEAPPTPPSFSAARLGSAEFRRDHGVRLAYVSGSMYKGIASPQMVIRMARAGLLGFLGAGGLRHDRLVAAIQEIQTALPDGQSYGLNLLAQPDEPERERELVELYMAHGVPRIEASAFTQLSPALVHYRAKGFYRAPDGTIKNRHWVLAKVSRPEVAAHFLAPAPDKLLAELRHCGKITADEAAWARRFPLADDLCIEADSGGHTDQGISLVLFPTMIRLRDQLAAQHGYAKKVRLGAAGGLGTPEALAAVFLLGADFVLTGSVNQCTVEADTSEPVKDMLAQAGVQDTTMAPAGDMFEVGARVQVLSKGVFFPARSQKLYDLYRHYNAWEEIEAKTREQIEKRYFKRSFAAVWAETEAYYATRNPARLARAQRHPKAKMALVFRWYFVKSTRAAQAGSVEDKVDFQIQCGPAMGAFNRWVQGTALEPWRARHVDGIADALMAATADYLQARFTQLLPG